MDRGRAALSPLQVGGGAASPLGHPLPSGEAGWVGLGGNTCASPGHAVCPPPRTLGNPGGREKAQQICAVPLCGGGHGEILPGLGGVGKI